MPQKGIAQMAIHQGAEGSAEMTQSREMGQQSATALQQSTHGISPWRQGKQGQRIRRSGHRFEHLTEALPLQQHCIAPQLLDDGFEAS